jgi:hypothetical protein
MKNTKRCILFFIGLALFASCQNTDLIDPVEQINNKNASSKESDIKNGPFEPDYENEYYKLAYDKNYNYPDGFYYEKGLTGAEYTAITGAKYNAVYYENTGSIRPISDREMAWIQLHTLDKDEARNWSNLTDENSSVHRNLIQENETEIYFEFLRFNASESQNMLSRVHRSDYFIPLCELFSPRSYLHIIDFNEIRTIGIYNGELTAEKVKEFVEYLWLIPLLMYGEKVVESTISEKDGIFEHNIQSLERTGGDWGTNDMIYVFNNKFILDKETKVLTFVDRTKVQEIIGEKK